MSALKRSQETASLHTIGRRKLLTTAGGVAALFVALLFFTALITLIGSNNRAEANPLENFLILLFKLHAGIGENQMDSLAVLNALDVAILILFSIMSLALYPILKQGNKAWAMIAVCLPFIGLGLYVMTHDIGRSGILGAGLIMAIMMLRSETFRKEAAYLGILASISLLVADIGTAFSYSIALAIFMGVGYVLFLAWCVLIGWRLFRLGLSETG